VILENINNGHPLAEIIEQITEMVSFKLRGAPCWCEIADGARLGNRPKKMISQRILREEIRGRAGAAHGTLFAAMDGLTKPVADEQTALVLGAELATLAIETSQLYTDLVHRSEYDLLTDVQNRFSLERNMDLLIQAARQAAGVFGLIYIDLNGFKQVNDQHGHQVGDLYLQEVSLRMQRQLRPGDTLARLGGDEFAVLVGGVRNRSDVEEIAQRLENCFDEPFTTESCVVHGSASVGIALYPEDGGSRDALFSAADSAMYKVKNAERNDAKEAGEGTGADIES
jgi:diguanylate cyclase (GGDEF)-like protein